ncbi:MAG: AraC family ligand binding domain-containing protein [Acidimicrobiia bacterium]|nr:AraC family ligand binding domain-containing protein [Acidimicrobiia bacterium]
MTEHDGSTVFVDRTDVVEQPRDIWPPVVIAKEGIDAEIERLAGLARPADGRRRSLIVHPRAEAPALGLAPGIRVSLEVLLPGEATTPVRHSSSVVNFCIHGAGSCGVDGRTIGFRQHDVWFTPALATYTHRNDTAERQVRLSYSNAALLEALNVHHVEENPADESVAHRTGPAEERDAHPFDEVFRLGEDGAHLMAYERLISPEVVEQRPLHWPWREVKPHLDELEALGADYKGRRLYLLYNPATGRTNGTTNSFFATMCLRPANIVDRPHRHSAAAVNYYFSGHGSSVVAGRTYHWKAGDLMLSAPGWAVHHHRSGDEPVYELTVQDSPLHLGMDSLMWQEDLKRPARLLGSHPGFATNRPEAEASSS